MYLAKVNYKKENVIEILSLILKDIISENTVVICIGTDRAIGDALGPLVGTMLKNSDFKYPVYGTLDNPIHALNIYESIDQIKEKHSNSEFLAIDACLGKAEQIGNILVKRGPVWPGAALQKDLPAVGHVHIKGVVNASGSMEFLTLQSTRLYDVMKMSEVIGKGIARYFAI